MKSLLQRLVRYLPILTVLTVGLTVAFMNIDPSRRYMGWDNIIAELDIWRYAGQIINGAWLSHAGLGAPAGQAHLSELFRLPFLFILSALLPQNLVRMSYIFLMYIIGGATMYMYLERVWLVQQKDTTRRWVSATGAVLYLLHLLTLQQFYIAFEMFTVQFAFLPLVFLTIHQLLRNFTRRNILFYILVQLLIAPSGHTPTIMYLGIICTLIYVFAIKFPDGFVKAVKSVFFIGLLTFFVHSYWIVPNIYYSVGPARAVQESRENANFGPESIWAVHDASTVSNFLEGTHYLLNWQQYDFATKKMVPTFGSWLDHLNNPIVTILAQIIGLVTIIGAGILIKNKNIGSGRWAILAIYFCALVLIWQGFFPDWLVTDRILASRFLLEVFRNTFTKLSIIYTFVSILLFTQTIVYFANRLNHKVFGVFITITITAICIVAFPAYQGKFINEKLRVEMPNQYQEMFAYLHGKSEHLRVMQLPQYRYVGWEYYEWSQMRNNNGYQGMGFYFFGMPQPYLMRDFDRWGETSDYFAHELKYAMDSMDPKLLINVMSKYQVDMIIVDETKVDPWIKSDYKKDHWMAQTAGLVKVWKKDFLTIYERKDLSNTSPFILPNKFPQNIYTIAQRTRLDTAIQEKGNYILSEKMNDSSQIYPFSSVLQRQPKTIKLTKNGVKTESEVPKGPYEITIPGISGDLYNTPIKASYVQGIVSITFPRDIISLDNTKVSLPFIPDSNKYIGEYQSISLLIQDTIYTLDSGNSTTFETTIDLTKDLEIRISPITDGFSAYSGEAEKVVIYPQEELSRLNQETFVISPVINKVSFETIFDAITPDEQMVNTMNCSYNQVGYVNTVKTDSQNIYMADKYGVNCGGYNFEKIAFKSSYVLHFSGSNILGRGIKLFVNYADNRIGSDEYIFKDTFYDSLITLPIITSTTNIKPTMNWEVRSAGMESRASISEVSLYSFPLLRIAGISIKPIDKLAAKVDNALEIKAVTTPTKMIYKVDLLCRSKQCVLGLDESYDRGWHAIDTTKILKHVTLNSWANAWIIEEGRHSIYIIYIPSVAVILSFLILLIAFGYFTFLRKY